MRYLIFFIWFYIGGLLHGFSDIKPILHEAIELYPEYNIDTLLLVNVPLQKLYFVKNGKITKEYVISTGRGGTSSKIGSNGTPLGWHRIWMKVGDGEPIGRNIYYKKVMPEIVPIYTNNTRSDKDYQTTRVLPLEGLQDGINKGGNVDSVKRGINIHGTPEEGRLGQAISRGCVRLKNTDVIELYNHVVVNTLVYIMGK
ncbi:MAG: L,D-transpeptidase [Brevinema sp.]